MGNPRIFISAGEASGDLHAAGLVRALRDLAPGAEIAGLGGPRLRQAGVRLLADTVDFGIIGLAPLAGSFWRYLDLLSRADRFLASWRPDVAVMIDETIEVLTKADPEMLRESEQVRDIVGKQAGSLLSQLKGFGK